MLRLLALVEKTLGKEWVGVTDWLRDLPANQVDAIEARLRANDYAGLVQEIEQAARTFAAASQAQLVRSGQAAAKWLDDHPALADRLVRFDANDDRIVRAARRNELDLVQGLTQETRQTVQRIVVDGWRENPRAVARSIRDSIGLTPTQEQHVRNYRRALETGDYGNAMGRALHDARSDARLRRLGRDGGALTEGQVDTMVDRYRRNYVAYRAETIARTEASRNVHAGIAESFRQAVERGDVDADQLVKEWIPGPAGEDARPEHRSRELLEQRPRADKPFTLPGGVRMMWPGDPAGGAEHTANCRCTHSTTLR